MPDYSKGKIYVVRSDLTDEIYVGSTVETLSQRMTKHRAHYKRWKQGVSKGLSLFKLFDLDPNCYIELIELYPCSCVDELSAREGHFQRVTPNCVNKRIEKRTRKQYYEDNKGEMGEWQKDYYKENKNKIQEYKKQYHIKNKDKLCEKSRKYRQDNIEKVTTKQKIYREENKDKVTEYNKQYREENKEKLSQLYKDYYKTNKNKILERMKEVVECGCGSSVRKSDYVRHTRTKKHLDYINNLT